MKNLFEVGCPHDEFEEMLALVPVGEPQKRDLRNRYLSRERLYHGILHLATMWQIHKKLRAEKINSAVPNQVFVNQYVDHIIASAIVYHDAVYDATSKTNEFDSATLWGSDISDVIADDFAGDVYQCIISTEKHLSKPHRGEVAEWFVGLDLASLAAPWDIFVLNNRLIRLEYHHLDDAAWRAGNGAFLRSLLTAPVIFREEVLRTHFEADARANLVRHLDGLS